MRLPVRRSCASCLTALLLVAACQPVEVLPIQTGQPRTDEISLLVAYGFQISHPPDAHIDTLVPAGAARTALRIRGPHLVIGLPDGTGTWHGPAYDLEILRFANPRALAAEEWVAVHVMSPATAVVEDTVHTRVSGRAAVRVATLAGDARVVTVWVPRDRQIVALRYVDFPVSSHPAAPAAHAVHRMMVSSFRYIEQ